MDFMVFFIGVFLLTGISIGTLTTVGLLSYCEKSKKKKEYLSYALITFLVFGIGFITIGNIQLIQERNSWCKEKGFYGQEEKPTLISENTKLKETIERNNKKIAEQRAIIESIFQTEQIPRKQQKIILDLNVCDRFC